MTQSVDELRREAERHRAELTVTVDRLKDRIVDTSENLRYRASPEHLKSEVSDLVSQKARGWADGLRQKAMDNPMQAVAVGTALAVPLLRIARGFPLPLLMIGAGLALTSKPLRERASAAVTPLMDQASQTVASVADRADMLGRDIADAASSALRTVERNVSQVTGAVGDTARQASGAASEAVQSTIESGAAALERGRSVARDTAAHAPAAAAQMIGDNAALVAGFGFAIGALLAASLPETRVESRLLGSAGDAVQGAAADAVQKGTAAVRSALDTVAGSDLGSQASQTTQRVAETAREIAGDIAEAVVDPSKHRDM